ncbi:MAG TPA: ABC transporter permease, partial [Flexilinea sp.]|nr:ABC transporter permease [Flexilinea sp.]
MEKQAVIQQKRKGFHFRLQVEERSDEPPKWLSPLLTVLALVVAFAIAGILIALVGGDPIYTYSRMWKAAFGTWFAFSDSLTKAIPLIFCGVACSLAFHMKIWNIGAEGQFFLGAFGASLVVLAPIVPKGSSSWVYIPTMMLSGMIFGALWGFIPGYLKAKLGVNEIISTLMLNYVAVAWNNFFLFGKWSYQGFQMSEKFPKEALLLRLSDIAKKYNIKALQGMALHLGIIFALVTAIIMYFVIYKSKWGYEIKLTGDNPNAAK